MKNWYIIMRQKCVHSIEAIAYRSLHIYNFYNIDKYEFFFLWVATNVSIVPLTFLYTGLPIFATAFGPLLSNIPNYVCVCFVIGANAHYTMMSTSKQNKLWHTPFFDEQTLWWWLIFSTKAFQSYSHFPKQLFRIMLTKYNISLTHICHIHMNILKEQK